MDSLCRREAVLGAEHGNSHDFYETTVKKDGLIVGRVPRELSKLISGYALALATRTDQGVEFGMSLF